MSTSKLCVWSDTDKKVMADIQLLNPIQDLKTFGEWVCVLEQGCVFVFNLDTELTLTDALAEIPVEIC